MTTFSLSSNNLIINSFKDLLFNLAKPELSKIVRFKNRHRNEACYIIGDGVSLKWFDLNNFSNKVSIALSLVFFHNDVNKLNLKYASFAEPYFFYPQFIYRHLIRDSAPACISEACRDVIMCNSDKDFFLNLSNYPVLRAHNVFYYFKHLAGEQFIVDMISAGLHPLNSSIRAAICMAIYMGFESVFLVGCDYTHFPSKSGHWYEKGPGTFYPLVDFQKTFFEIAKEYIDITTIVLNGSSEFINSVTYKQHTGQDPRYRENIEIINHKYLQTLAANPFFTIY